MSVNASPQGRFLRGTGSPKRNKRGGSLWNRDFRASVSVRPAFYGENVMQPTAQPTNDVRETQNLIASDKVEGTPVRRTDGEKIGTIERVMIDKRSGQVAYAVMSFGGFMGLGEEYYTLPWGVLKYNTGLDAYELNLTEDQLRGAPRRTAEGHDASYDREWEEHVHRYYNATPYWGASDPMSTGR
jgi:sporulation protein YlmC with PRC-barrel domain